MKKVGLFSLALLVALAAMGFGFAHWGQTLFIGGHVETGTYLVGFETCSTNDPDCTTDPGYDKDVGSTTCQLWDPKGCHGGATVFEEMAVFVDNAYPSYHVDVDYTIGNGGTIPAKVVRATLDAVSWGNNFRVGLNIPLPKGSWVTLDIDQDGDDDVSLKFTGPADQQIDPCDTLEFDLHIHFEQGVEQDTLYTFFIKIDTIQWNL